MSLRRRGFIQALGLAGFATALPRTLYAKDRQVLVLGAGLAGLRTAQLLGEAGFAVTVIEARDRVGGRLFTLDGVPGHPEGGGNTIGPNYGRVIGTSKALGVELHTPARAEAMGLMLGDERVDRETWPDSPLNTLPPPLRAVTPDRLGFGLLRENPLQASDDWRSAAKAGLDQSAVDFYRSKGLDDTALAWINANNSYGNTLEETSLLSLYRVGSSIGRAIAMRQPVFEAREGNQRIPEAMAAALPGELVLGEQVVAVRQGRNDIVVECASGRRFEGDALVCTLPVPALRKLSFEPGLTGMQAEAVNKVAYHTVTQAHFVSPDAWWAEQDEPGGWWTDGPLGRVFTRRSPAGHYNTTCWINGESCTRFDVMERDLAMQVMEEDFFRMLPAAKGRASLEAMVSWANEPHNGGAWAIWRPGEIARYADALTTPHGRIAFAGEHTAFSNSGMEGAMESGDRAALEVMRWLA
ncbi:MAG: FAD-dependent oxidoreductase [Pseudomonadota bacterium]